MWSVWIRAPNWEPWMLISSSWCHLQPKYISQILLTNQVHLISMDNHTASYCLRVPLPFMVPPILRFGAWIGDLSNVGCFTSSETIFLLTSFDVLLQVKLSCLNLLCQTARLYFPLLNVFWTHLNVFLRSQGHFNHVGIEHGKVTCCFPPPSPPLQFMFAALATWPYWLVNIPLPLTRNNNLLMAY